MTIFPRTRAAHSATATVFALASVSAWGWLDIEVAIDCADICNRHVDCYDHDTGACASRFRANADDEREFAAAANARETCLDHRSCTGSSVCTDECRGVVP